ncbi:MAG: hypothetical protein ACREUT_17185 [Steroidobacteraceae bacterium]
MFNTTRLGRHGIRNNAVGAAISSVFVSLVLCGCGAGSQTAVPKAGASANDLDAVIQLVKSGMPDSLVVKTIQKDGKSYTLAPADVLRLRNAGVSNAVIEAMVDASPAPAAAPVAPRAARVAAAPAAAAPGDREPTEAEMLAVFQASAAAGNSELKAREDQCRSGAYRTNNDPMAAMMCLGGALVTGGRGGMRQNITGFRKVACGRASGRAGWVCDYIMQTHVTGINAPPSLRAMMNTPTIQHARFVYTGGQWIIVQ